MKNFLFIKVVFFAGCFVTAFVFANQQMDKKTCETKCFSASKDPERKKHVITIAGEKLMAQLDEVENALKSEKDDAKRKELENKREDLVDKVEAKVEKFCKNLCSHIN